MIKNISLLGATGSIGRQTIEVAQVLGITISALTAKSNVELLEDNFYNLQEQYADIEDVDMADALTSFVWAQYCYNAALKVGNSVLSESLMDYLK